MDIQPRPTGSDGKVLPERRPSERMLAEHIGAVVILASQLDAVLATLVDCINGGDGAYAPKASGGSGKQLADQLATAAKVAPEAASFADRYRKLYSVRNQLVHGIRMTGDPTADPNVTIKLNQNSSSSPTKGLYMSQVLGVPELIDLWYDMDDLRHEALPVLVRYSASTTLGVSSVQPPES